MFSLILVFLVHAPSRAQVETGVAEVRLRVQRCMIQNENDERATIECFADGARRLIPYLTDQLGGSAAFRRWSTRTEDKCDYRSDVQPGTRVQRDLRGVRCYWQSGVRQLNRG